MEENTIVNEVTFGETSNGAAMVQGSFVGQGASKFDFRTSLYFSFSYRDPAHARMTGPYGNRGSNESREQTIANGEYIQPGTNTVFDKLWT